MFHIITCSTKILTLAIVPFWFISVGVLCEFAVAPNVCILLSPQKEEMGVDRITHENMYRSDSTLIKKI